MKVSIPPSEFSCAAILAKIFFLWRKQYERDLNEGITVGTSEASA
jgi:hypothetical protein